MIQSQLGGNLDVNGTKLQVLVVEILKSNHGTGKVQISGIFIPTADGNTDPVLATNGSGQLVFTRTKSSGSGMQNVNEDTHELGGNLDVVTHPNCKQ